MAVEGSICFKVINNCNPLIIEDGDYILTFNNNNNLEWEDLQRKNQDIFKRYSCMCGNTYGAHKRNIKCEDCLTPVFYHEPFSNLDAEIFDFIFRKIDMEYIQRLEEEILEIISKVFEYFINDELKVIIDLPENKDSNEYKIKLVIYNYITKNFIINDFKEVTVKDKKVLLFNIKLKEDIKHD